MPTNWRNRIYCIIINKRKNKTFGSTAITVVVVVAHVGGVVVTLAGSHTCDSKGSVTGDRLVEGKFLSYYTTHHGGIWTSDHHGHHHTTNRHHSTNSVSLL